VDQERFDQLTVAVARGGDRRTVLAVLSGALISAGLLAAPAVDGKGKRKHKAKGKGKAAAAKRRQQRDQRKKRDTATAQACPLCKRLNAQGRCVADTSVNGRCCPRAGGQRGQCLNGSCWPGQCSGFICTGQTCPDGCCDAQGSCHVNDPNACGTGGGSCTVCVVTSELCQGGACVCPSGVICSASGCCPNASDECDADDQCCTPKTCADLPGQCGTLDDGCDGVIDCGGCPMGQTCGGGGVPNQCGCPPPQCPAAANCGTITNACGAAVTCGGPCPASAPACIANVCGICSATNAGTSCVPPDGDTDQATCQANGRCCVESGGDSGGVPGQSCFTANCCSRRCFHDATRTVCF
jgi:hypothetical protein